jgi:hypothetical protein
MTLEELEAERENRRTFRQVFVDSPGGSGVLTWILSECGYFSSDPQAADPLLTGFCNKLLGKIGAVHPENIFNDTRARLETANDRDLDRLEKALKEGF